MATMIARTFIIIQIAVCTLSLFFPQLPGWKMFASVEPLTFMMTDSKHEEIDPRALTPYPSYGLNNKDLARIAEFRCRRDHDVTSVGSKRASPPDCQLEK